MIARVWRGYTTPENAGAYEAMLKPELLPGIGKVPGYRGSYLLRRETGPEVEFITMLWFESLEKVKSFAGENYAKPVISEKARALLARYVDHAEHYELAGSSEPGFTR